MMNFCFMSYGFRLVAMVLLLATSAAGQPVCDCADAPPKGSWHSCYEMMMWGQCSEPWMKGSCECTCGKCQEIWVGECMCNETPPPDSPYSCEQQKKQGKCGQDWMQGFCECSCGKCGDMSNKQSDHQQNKESFKEESKQVYSTPKEITQSQQQTQSIFGRRQTPGSSSQNGNVKFTIIHFNDFHARVTPVTEWWWPCEDWRNNQGECYGGLARVKTIVDQERAKGLPVFVLDAGDDMIGTDWNYHYWALEPAAKLFNDIGVDALALGNHDFDHGADSLATYLEAGNYPALSCNMEANGHQRLAKQVQGYIIREVSGKKVGIFGLTTTYTNWAKAADPAPVYFTDESQAATECVQELKNQGVDIIIALTHQGFNADKYLARQIADIDIVIGGHSHAVLTGDKTPVLSSGASESSWGHYPSWESSWVQNGRSIPVVQVGWATRYIGRMTVEFDQDGNLVSFDGEPILLDGNVPEDQAAKNFADSKMHW